MKPEQAPKGQSWKPTWRTYREGHVSSEKVDEASLDVDSENPTGALGVYQRAGFQVEAKRTDYSLRTG